MAAASRTESRSAPPAFARSTRSSPSSVARPANGRLVKETVPPRGSGSPTSTEPRASARARCSRCEATTMTSNPAPSLGEFADAARAWLSTVAQPRSTVEWGVGSDSVAVFENWTAEEERSETDRISAYERAKYDAGWGALTWSEEYGGRNLPMAHALAFRREEEAFDVPRRTEMFSVTQQLVAPTVAQWGTPEQRERFVGAMLRTDLIACQLFSETEAGSD